MNGPCPHRNTPYSIHFPDAPRRSPQTEICLLYRLDTALCEADDLLVHIQLIRIGKCAITLGTLINNGWCWMLPRHTIFAAGASIAFPPLVVGKRRTTLVRLTLATNTTHDGSFGKTVKNSERRQSRYFQQQLDR